MNVKKYLTITLITSIFVVFQTKAQDIFEKDFYAPDLAIKHREEIKISESQLDKIYSSYNTATESFKAKKKLLSAAIAELRTTINETSISNDKALVELEKINALELEIKKLKLSMLIEVKNALSSNQQNTLDKYKKENQLMLKALDMSISERDSAVTLKIRGNVTDKNKVVWVLKGSKKEMNLEEMKQLNPDNIKSIEVFKGGAAVAKFGEQGRNGVVLIELKKVIKQ